MCGGEMVSLPDRKDPNMADKSFANQSFLHRKYQRLPQILQDGKLLPKDVCQEIENNNEFINWITGLVEDTGLVMQGSMPDDLRISYQTENGTNVTLLMGTVEEATAFLVAWNANSHFNNEEIQKGIAKAEREKAERQKDRERARYEFDMRSAAQKLTTIMERAHQSGFDFTIQVDNSSDVPVVSVVRVGLSPEKAKDMARYGAMLS